MPKLQDFVGYLGHYMSPLKSINDRQELTLLGLTVIPLILVLFKAIILVPTGFLFFEGISSMTLRVSVLSMMAGVLLVFFNLLIYINIEALAFVLCVLILTIVFPMYENNEALVLLAAYFFFFFIRQNMRKKSIKRE